MLDYSISREMEYRVVENPFRSSRVIEHSSTRPASTNLPDINQRKNCKCNEHLAQLSSSYQELFGKA